MQLLTPTGSLIRLLADVTHCDIATSLNGVTLLRQEVPHGRLHAAFLFEYDGRVMGCFNAASRHFFERLVESDDLIVVAIDHLRYSGVDRPLEMDPLSEDILVELRSGKRRRLIPLRTGDVVVARSFIPWSA